MEECLKKPVHARMHRKNILEPISIGLGINPKRFKNKVVLVNEIRRVRALSKTQRCYNNTDPCTMESLDDIDDEFYIEWSQYNHRFGADARSIKKMLDMNNTILPWSIDFSTGIQASLDHETYRESFDMTLVPGLLELVNRVASDSDQTSITDDPVCTNNSRILFEIERILGDDARYAYGVILNKIINNKSVRNIYCIVSENMYRVMFQLRNDPANHLYFDAFYQYCYVYYTSQAFHIRNKKAHLEFLLYTLTMFHELLGEAASYILQMVFMDM